MSHLFKEPLLLKEKLSPLRDLGALALKRVGLGVAGRQQKRLHQDTQGMEVVSNGMRIVKFK